MRLNNMSPLLAHLRHSTADVHERLHHHDALRLLTDEAISLDYYTHALSKFFSFYLPLENGLNQTKHQATQDFISNHTLNNLQSDLIRFDILPASIRPYDLWDGPFSLEQSLAYLYVREGSALGGQVISKKLQDHLSLKPGIDNKFFYGRGELTGEAWKKFMALLGQLENQVDKEKVGTYARDLFRHLDKCLLLKEENAS